MRFLIDNKIPFIKGRLEPLGEVVYAGPDDFTPGLVHDADVLVVRTRAHCDARLLQGSAVRLVVTATIGTDHIDLDWCAANGVQVRNAAGCNAPGVAQYVWSTLLRTGFDPARHTLGIVGCGNVGSIVAEWGSRFGVSMMICDPPKQRAGAEGSKDWTDLRTLLRNCDAVTLHTPLTHSGPDATHHLIGAGELALMRPGALLINSSRGPVVDNRAWAQAVQQRRVRAAVDVWETEPLPDPVLLRLAQVATPHIAGYSRQGKERATRMALEAIGRWLGAGIDTSGLEGPYRGLPYGITAGEVMQSYDPMADTTALRERPGDFEKLRGDYKYRNEPGF